MTRSKSIKQIKSTKKVAKLQYAIQPEISESELTKTVVSTKTATSKLVAIHSNLQLAAWLEPSHDNYFRLAEAFFTTGHIAESIENYHKALEYNPNSSDVRFNLGVVLSTAGRLEDSIESYLKVIALDERNVAAAFENMLALYDIRYPLEMAPQKECLRLYNEYRERQLSDLTHAPFDNLTLHTPLRIGFVSADLRFHPVGYFLESTLEQIKKDPKLCSRLELIAYYNNDLQDEKTFDLSEYFDQWYRVNEWSDERLMAQIKRDHIDILFDLSGYTLKHRLPMFARKAAPVQVSWLGYWGSTGMSAMDYALVDPISVRADEECWFVEKIWRLPHLRYCFSIPKEAPDVSLPPCLSRPEVVFGCYQELRKINAGVLQCWKRIFAASPNARLRIQSRELLDPDIKKQFKESLATLGLDLSRIELFEHMARADYFSSYAKVDVILDTFPYPGGTTTVEALWMGVPTITLALPKMLGRQGEALLVNAGLADWVAYNEDEYVQKAIDWANADAKSRQCLANLRQGMRDQIKHSPLFNAKQFAHEFVDALYGMWEEKCLESANRNDG